MTERETSATVLATSGNYAVIQLNDRRYPALSIQGDSLKILQETIEELAEDLRMKDLAGADLSLREVRSVVSDMLSSYESAAADKGFELPYTR
ncbi:DUF6959 family protein [Streptomyces sp. NPDC059247]|uniref:DUF6959 family protein n=1 Tax=Streptomyces sp. NPDC059247 TaxID=3346790 RepID=UPI00369423F0